MLTGAARRWPRWLLAFASAIGLAAAACGAERVQDWPAWQRDRAALERRFVCGEFRIHYTFAGRHALSPDGQRDGDLDGVPDGIQNIALQLSTAKRCYVEVLGLRHPFESPRYKGRVKFVDVNVMALGDKHGMAGDAIVNYHRPDDPPEGVEVLTIDLSATLSPRNLTPAHELFHIFQNGYTLFKNAWYYEGTARWSEDLLREGAGEPGALPATEPDIEGLFKLSYAASRFWQALARATDPVGKVRVPQDLRAIRYPGSSKSIVEDDVAYGAPLLKALLEELDLADDAVARESGLYPLDWSEARQRSPGNDRPIWNAVIRVCGRFPAASAALQRLGGATGRVAVQAGVGRVDITPNEPVILAGSPTQLKSTSVSTRLYAKALVLSGSGQKVAIVTLDTLKYPVEQVVRARRQVEQATGIPAGNVIICASHTHRGPLWSYYKDQLATPIAEAVGLAVRDLAPCRLSVAQGRAEGVSECRRVIKEGHAWNRWQLPPGDAGKYPAEGPADPGLDVLAVIAQDGKYKAIVYNFACHAANTRDLAVSADYPGDVQQYVQKHLGYDVPALFLPGACGDVNPIYSVRPELFGEKLGAELLRCLGQLEPVAKPSLAIDCREIQMPGREQPEFQEAEIAQRWPAQLEHYRTAYAVMKKREKPAYGFFISGIRLGDDFAIVTNPGELFCEIGMSIKKQSPFKHTMVAEQTNGAHGYVPTAKAFAGGSYETWFGEHSYLTTRAGEIIEKESLDILNRLKHTE